MAEESKAKAGAALPAGLTLRVGGQEIQAAQWRSALPPALAAYNEKMRLEGLPDHLNPGIIDPEKAAAFLTALPGLASKALAGKSLSLYDGRLLLGASSPVRPEDFAKAQKLEIEKGSGGAVRAHLRLAADCTLARERAEEAREKLEPADGEIRKLEARQVAAAKAQEPEHAVLMELSLARRRRSALAYAWQENARAWAACPDGGAAAKAGLKAAEQAVEKYALPLGSGLP